MKNTACFEITAFVMSQRPTHLPNHICSSLAPPTHAETISIAFMNEGQYRGANQNTCMCLKGTVTRTA